MKKSISNSDNIEAIISVEKMRAEGYAKAKREWDALTEKDEWPEEEHDARFEALLGMALNTRPPKL